MDRILQTIQMNNVEHATVVGGGFIGLEMMESLHHLGIKTTLLELADQVMTPVDREMAGFVHQAIREQGVDLRLGTALTGVNYQAQMHLASAAAGEETSHQHIKGHLSLTLSNGETLDTDLLIMAIGVRPETQLARDAGLAIGELGGIAVNTMMQKTVANSRPTAVACSGCSG